ncbi:MAG: hypothetical protein KTR31_04000 [Myxococcales bacterium]|nr:hypothetical protein [Myxococcales bacterium]
MIVRTLAAGLTLALIACTGDTDPTTKTDTTDDPTDDTVEDTVDTADNGGDEGFEPVAVGFEIEGAVDAEGNLTSWLDADGDEISTIIIMTFASKDFFSTGADDEACIVIAPYTPKGRLLAGDHFPTSDKLPMTEAYDEALDLDITNTNCGGLVNEKLFGADAAALLTPFVGARIGYGWRPMETTDDIYDTLGQGTLDDEEILGGLFTQYFAFTDTAGVFEGDALSIGSSFGFNPKTKELLLDPKDKTLLLWQNVDASVAGNPDGLGSLGPVYFRSSPIFYPFYDRFAEDLSVGAP